MRVRVIFGLILHAYNLFLLELWTGDTQKKKQCFCFIFSILFYRIIKININMKQKNVQCFTVTVKSNVIFIY